MSSIAYGAGPQSNAGLLADEPGLTDDHCTVPCVR